MLVDFCLPIKNEELILKNSLDKLLIYCRQSNFPFVWRIVGVLNGSTDSSRLILTDFKLRFPQELDFIEIKEPGRGGALKQYWSTSSADILVYMDADLAVSLDNIFSLVDPLIKNEQDLAVGSRFVSGAETKRSLGREVISRAYSFLSQVILNQNITDLQCGFKAVRRETFLKIQPFLRDNYWFFDTELVVLLRFLGYRVKEVPVNWQENRFSRRQSKVKLFRDSLIFFKNLISFRQRLKKIKKCQDNA